jgi:AcrR family transcriptional regulator
MSEEREVPPAARQEAVTAVMRALARHGYAGLTTKKVAAESEKSEAFLFYHYDTKEDLVLAFLDFATGRVADRLAELTDADPVTRLYAACDCLLGDPDDEVDTGIAVAMMELLSHAPHNERFHDRLSTYERAVLADLTGVLREGVDAGVFREVDPDATAAFLLTTTDGTAGAEKALGMHDVGAGVRERLFDYLDRVVLAEGVDPPAGYGVRSS